MSSYDHCSLLAAESMAILRPFLEETQGSYVVTDKGRLAPYLQSVVGDLIFNDRAGGMWTTEVKHDGTGLNNVFLETWSNRNLDELANRHVGGRKPGWLYTLNADLLFYHFVRQDRMAIFNLPALQSWCFTAPSIHFSEPDQNGIRTKLSGRLYDFRELRQRTYQQRNDTWGRPVPLKVLMREVDPPPKLVQPRQITLDLFEQAAW